MVERDMKGEGRWIATLAVVFGAFLIGTSHPFGGGNSSAEDHSSFAPQQIVVSFPDATLTPYIETATAKPSQTAVIVIATTTPSNQLPWCYTVKLGESCSLPGVAARPKATPTLISCEAIQMTPATYVRHCTKTDEAGANARYETS